MISVDDRVGSIELAKPLATFGVRVRVRRLQFGDLAFVGNGPGDTLARVGIERKTIGDLMSSLQSGRLVSHQLPGMIDTYSHRYLLIEGEYRSEPGTGMLQVPQRGGWVDQGFGRRRFYHAGLIGWLNTLAVQAGVWIVRTRSIGDSCSAVTGLYRWWQKPWADHKSLLPVLKRLQQQRDPSKVDEGAALSASIRQVTTLRKILAQVPSIGWVRSAAVERHFGTLQGALDGSDSDWQRIDGFGRTLAARARHELGCRDGGPGTADTRAGGSASTAPRPRRRPAARVRG